MACAVTTDTPIVINGNIMVTRISINDEQDDQDHEHDGGLDHVHIANTDVREVVAGGRGAGQVCSQRGSRDGLFDDVGDPAESLVQLGCAHAAGEHHGQVPGFVILAGHGLAQGRCVDESCSMTMSRVSGRSLSAKAR